jgi:hypothetical protein
MYPILALQTAAVGLVLFVTSASPPVTPVRSQPQPAIGTAAPVEGPRLRCRLYFGCVPGAAATQVHHD